MICPGLLSRALALFAVLFAPVFLNGPSGSSLWSARPTPGPERGAAIVDQSQRQQDDESVGVFRFTGICVAVKDGDTVTVLANQREHGVRLEGIDCPEAGQDFSAAAKRHTASLIHGKSVEVVVVGVDRYGRMVGRVWSDGTDCGLALLQAGLAWHFTRYSNDPAYARAEKEARSKKLRIWSLPDPIPPWDWRDGLRERESDKGLGPAFRGNKRSRVFHKASCRYYSCQNCVLEFATRESAVASGFRPCGHCRP